MERDRHRQLNEHAKEVNKHKKEMQLSRSLKKEVVAGANGTTGKKIVRLLKASQYFNPIAMVRKEAQVEHFKKENVDTVLADLTKDLSHVMKNVDKVIFAAGSG